MSPLSMLEHASTGAVLGLPKSSALIHLPQVVQLGPD
jgi:hypothetical protein